MENRKTVLHVFCIIFVWLQVVFAVNDQFRKSKYSIKYNDAYIPKNHAKALLTLNYNEQYNGIYEILKIDRETEQAQYICLLPRNGSQTDPLLESDHYAISNETKLIENAVEVIGNSFSTSSCVYAYALDGGYWTFSYCFGDKVSQFHPSLEKLMMTGKHVPEYPDYVYILGRFNGPSKGAIKIENQSPWNSSRLSASDFSLTDNKVSPFTPGSIYDRHTQRSLRHTLSDGELCDLTLQPRKVDVIYKCHLHHLGKPEILSVHEVKTCQYEMTISIPQLCSIRELRPTNADDMENKIECKLIDEIDSALPSYTPDFEKYNNKAPFNDRKFPVPLFYKINLSSLWLSPCGSNFYLGQNKVETSTSNLYFNLRTVLVFNGEYNSDQELANKVSKMVANGIGRIFIAPQTDLEEKQLLVQWSDSFTLWFELYDFYATLIYLVRIQRDGSFPEKTLDVKLVDPNNMLDHNGSVVDPPKWDATKNAWNFEEFSKSTVKVADTAL
ncbi:uncharacterized protein PRCAT00001081001 [Priceomyces carsonii]|uniref:uncharacterized protein n=1 Tax=Priceomyces carsonii TaxID=28549 RepID=UPI002ED8503A|nr:unnamed protein product [Priceomyces carsonii]